MENQPILDCIKQQGVGKGQLKSSLISSNTSSSPRVAWRSVWGIVIGIAVLGGETSLADQTNSKLEKEISSAALDQIALADQLISCSAYKITFKHPFTGDMLEKEILGMIDGKCGYVEQMPMGGTMQCNYSESERIAAAQVYKDLAMAEATDTTLNIGLRDGKMETTYTINGKVLDDPLQALEEFMNNGTCVISGYDY